MISKERIYKIGDLVKKYCTADDYTIYFNGSDSIETRFAQNAITQHITGENNRVAINVSYGNKKGMALTNQYDEDSIKQVVEKAQEIAKLNQPDPEHIPSAEAAEYMKVKNFAEATDNLKVDEMVEIVEKSIANAEKQGAKLSGMTEKGHGYFYTIAKNGFEGFFESSVFGHSMTIKKDDMETKVSSSVMDYKSFDLDKEIEKLNNQLYSLKDMKHMDAQKIPVILRPAAVSDLFGFLLYFLNMREADEGLTPFTGMLGKKAFGDKFNLISSMQDKELLRTPFSGDGVVGKDIAWVENGILKNMPSEKSYALKKGIEPANVPNAIILGGDCTEEEMMKMVPRGIIINALWYIRVVDMKKGELTGLTRDGVMYFEDGKIKNAVHNFRWNEVIPEVTNRILAMGKEELVRLSLKVPSMLINNFNFVDTTTF